MTNLDAIIEANLDNARRFNVGMASELEIVRPEDDRVGEIAAAAGDMGFDLGKPRTMDDLLRRVSDIYSVAGVWSFHHPVWTCVQPRQLSDNAIKVPFCTDLTRFVFYHYTKLVAETMVARVFYLTVSESDRYVHNCKAHVLNIRTLNSQFSSIPSFYRYWGSIYMRSFWDSRQCEPIYSHEDIGHKAGAVAYTRVTYNAESFDVMSAGNDVLVSTSQKLTPSMEKHIKLRTKTLGRCGSLLGLIPPMDDAGRFVVVLPVERFALSCKARSDRLPVRRTMQKIDEFTRLFAGKPPLWMTPAGRFTTEECL